MAILEKAQAAQLLSREDCDENVSELWETYKSTSSPVKKKKLMKEIDSWLETRLFVDSLERRANGL